MRGSTVIGARTKPGPETNGESKINEFWVMTTKEKAISAINSLDDNATLDEMIERLYLLRKIELGIAQADAGDVMPHEEFMAELEREDVK